MILRWTDVAANVQTTSKPEMATVMEWVGHDEMAMVMHYYRLRNEFAQKAMKQFAAGLDPAGSPS